MQKTPFVAIMKVKFRRLADYDVGDTSGSSAPTSFLKPSVSFVDPGKSFCEPKPPIVDNIDFPTISASGPVLPKTVSQICVLSRSKQQALEFQKRVEEDKQNAFKTYMKIRRDGEKIFQEAREAEREKERLAEDLYVYEAIDNLRNLRRTEKRRLKRKEEEKLMNIAKEAREMELLKLRGIPHDQSLAIILRKREERERMDSLNALYKTDFFRVK